MVGALAKPAGSAASASAGAGSRDSICLLSGFAQPHILSGSRQIHSEPTVGLQPQACRLRLKRP